MRGDFLVCPSVSALLCVCATLITLSRAQFVYDVSLMDTGVVQIDNTWDHMNETDSPLIFHHTFTSWGDDIVVFGGVLEEPRGEPRFVNDDVFVFNPETGPTGTWTRIPYDGTGIDTTQTEPSPAPRSEHTAVVYDDRLWIFAGATDAGNLNDLWTWTKNGTWTRIDSTGWDPAHTPPPLMGHTAVQFEDQMYIFGGREEISPNVFAYKADVWQYNFGNNTWQVLTPSTSEVPLGRVHHAAVLYQNMTYVQADLDPAGLNTICARQACIYVHGGENPDAGFAPLDEIWMFTVDDRQWYRVYYNTGMMRLVDVGQATPRFQTETQVSGRRNHKCVMVLDRMMCYGGYDYPGFTDLVEYDPIFNRWFTPWFINAASFGLQGHGMVWHKDVLYIHGGLAFPNRDFPDPPLITSVYRRPICQSGYSQPDGNWMCFPCTSGLAAFSGQRYCEQCAPGRYADDTLGQNTNCTECPAGTFNTLYGQQDVASCTLCPLGTAGDAPGNSNLNCDTCQGGLYQDQVGQTSCKDCPAGTFRTNPQPADPLPIDVSFCADCGVGTYSPAGSLLCFQCQAGFFAPTPGSPFCTPCSAGSYSGIASSSCTNCPIGTFSTKFGAQASDITACIDCPPGTHNPSTGQPSCTPCPAGQFQDLEGQAACKNCAAGTFGNTTGLPIEQCYDCPAGTYQDVPAQAECKQCPVATFSTALGADSIIVCSACPDGTFSPDSGNDAVSDCTSCLAGTWAARTPTGDGLVQCYECPPGHYLPDTGADGDNDCLPCPAMSYSSTAGTGTCIECPEGTYSHGGWRHCVNCSETAGEHEGWVQNGHFDLDWLTDDFTKTHKWTRMGAATFLMGSIPDLNGNFKMRPDSEYPGGDTGHFGPGFMRFVVSTPGQLFHYQQIVQMDTVNTPRMHCSGWSRSANLLNLPGFTGEYYIQWAFHTTNGNVTDVIQQSWTSQSGDPGLDAWEFVDVYYQPEYGIQHITIDLIARNWAVGIGVDARIDWDDIACAPDHADVCQCIDIPGTYFDRNETDAITESHCIWCDASFACRAGVQFKCAADEFSHGQQERCRDCLPGWRCTYERALPCDYLWYIDHVVNECYRCIPGHECGERELLPCWAGTYGDGGYECILCKPGTFTNVTGMRFCWNCPAGTQSNYMRTGCAECEPDYYSPGGQLCERCPKGMYVAAAGAAKCTSCKAVNESVHETISRNTPCVANLLLIPLKCVPDVDYNIINVIHNSAVLGNVVTEAPDMRAITYEPAAGAMGQHDFDVVYDVGDGQTMTISVFITIVNSPPVPYEDLVELSATESSVTVNVLTNDEDAERDALFIDSYQWDFPGDQGIGVSISADQQSFTFTFPSGFTGTADNFFYLINDNATRSETRARVILCRACSTPTAGDDHYIVPQGTLVSLNVLVNDNDADGDVLTVSSVSVSAQGVLPVIDGTNIRYFHPQAYCGPDSFTYTASSVDGQATATVTTQSQNCLCHHHTDIAIALYGGSTANSGTEFTFQTSFVSGLVARMQFDGENGPKIALFQYSSNVTLEQTFNALQPTLNGVLLALTWQNSPGADWHKLLTDVDSAFTTDGRGSGFPRQLIIITSTADTSTADTVGLANIIKSTSPTTHIYIIQVGITLPNLDVSSGSAYVYTAPDYLTMSDTVLIPLMDNLCDESREE